MAGRNTGPAKPRRTRSLRTTCAAPSSYSARPYWYSRKPLLYSAQPADRTASLWSSAAFTKGAGRWLDGIPDRQSRGGPGACGRLSEASGRRGGGGQDRLALVERRLHGGQLSLGGGDLLLAHKGLACLKFLDARLILRLAGVQLGLSGIQLGLAFLQLPASGLELVPGVRQLGLGGGQFPLA